MSYRVDAWIENGEHRLRLVDSDTGVERLYWSFGSHVDQAHGSLKSLFKALFLLACEDKTRLHTRAVRKDFGMECTTCSSCVKDGS